MEDIDKPEQEEVVNKNPNLDLADLIFALSLTEVDRRDTLQKQILQIITEKKMAPLYESLIHQGLLLDNSSLLSQLKIQNEKDLADLKVRHDDAVENFGENEVREALLARSEYLTSIGDKEKSVSSFRETYEKTVALGQKLDIIFSTIRVGFFFRDFDLISRNLDKAKTLIEEGGDWDRRNRLKVYDGLHKLMIREFKVAANLFLESIATFTSYELFSFKRFTFLTVLMSVVSLDRVSLKTKVINSPEILSVIDDIPALGDFLNCLYKCDYSKFFSALATITDAAKDDRYLNSHYAYFCREMRIVAYTQILESYISVTLESMANAFGVSVAFLDRELSRFISAGRLNCKIDKVSNIVETTRPDSKNAKYLATIKQGDLLLNRIQKLSRFINL